MTKHDIVVRVQQQIGLPVSTVAGLIDEMLDIMKERLARGEEVKIAKFGSFRVQTRSQRPGRNPRTGAPIIIPEHKVLTFTPSKHLKNNV